MPSDAPNCKTGWIWGLAMAVWAMGLVHPHAAPKGLEDLFRGGENLPQATEPFVLYIDSDPAEDLRTNRATVAKINQIRGKIEAVAGIPCRMAHYTQITSDGIRQAPAKAVIFTAWKPLLDRDQAGKMDRMLREVPKPILSICGGFHLTYRARGGICSNMRRLAPGEKDPNPAYMPGYLKEWGWGSVEVLKDDPIFSNLPGVITVAQRHGAACAVLPADFTVLAGSSLCPVQVIRHTNQVLYGTQFHPEMFDDGHPQGRILLGNFFRLAGIDR